jgi:hypothetical protein
MAQSGAGAHVFGNFHPMEIMEQTTEQNWTFTRVMRGYFQKRDRSILLLPNEGIQLAESARWSSTIQFPVWPAANWT